MRNQSVIVDADLAVLYGDGERGYPSGLDPYNPIFMSM
jgi:hypothetical protein